MGPDPNASSGAIVGLLVAIVSFNVPVSKSRVNGKVYSSAQAAERIEAVIVRRVDLESRPHGLVERSRDFTLVPWRDVLALQVGKSASGIMRVNGMDWRFGRTRSGPEFA